MAGVSFKPRAIFDGQVVIAHDYGVVFVIFHVEDWTVDFANRFYAESTSLTGTNPNTLVRLDGAVPGAGTRKRMAELQAELNSRIPHDDRRVAVMTDSVLVRGAMTAMRWITGDQLNGFATTDVQAAAEWVGGPEGNTDKIVALYNACSDFPR